ncbi:histidine phosphatase family protein [Virgibacillus kekensis]|uniref:Histidine phosphatase family protein n=1 Tax=Virgibacillus kekensis TaxID=202261 RepID=A0ABV9DKC8_9BACI
MKTVIYMVRHAKSPFVLGEESTRPLSSEGLTAANKVMDILIKRDIDYIVSSPYKRAVQTVEGLAKAKGLPVHQYEELRERAIKGLEFELSEDEIDKAIEWSFKDKNFCLENGETTKQAQNRSIPLIMKLLRVHKGENIVIGTHGNIMTIIMNFFNDNFGFDFWKSTSKPDIYKLIFNGEELDSVERIWEE